MKYTKHLFASIIIVIFSCIGFISCSEEEPKPEDTAIEFVRAIEQGNYIKAAQLTDNLDSTSVEYRNIIIARYKQMATEINQLHGKTTGITCTHTEIQPNNTDANVFLHLTFSNNTATDIAIQLTKRNQEWLIK